MKTIFGLCVAIVCGLISASSANADVFFNESFDDSTGFETSISFFSDTTDTGSGGFDFFGLGGTANDWGGDLDPRGLKPYTGFSGGFLTGMDLDGEGAELPVTVTWTGIDISGRTGLSFSGDFAEFFDDPGDIDELDQLFVEAQIDGGGFSKIMEFIPGDFTSSSGNFNGFFQRDGLNLGDAAQNFQADIAGTGSLLDLRLTVSVNSGDEDFGADNFQLSSIPEPGSMVLLGLGMLGVVARRRRLS